MKEYFEKTTLPNGLRIVTERIPQFRSASIGVWVDVGSSNEDASNRGISHFLEHSLFKGTPTRTARDIAETMDGIGGNLNAFTEKEQTCFYAKVMDKHIDIAMEMIGDMVQNATFPEAEVEKEKNVVLEEINMYEDSPGEMVFDMITQAAWENHPLGRSILGTAESVMAINREMLLNFVKHFYTPANIIVSAAGKVKHEKIVALCEKYLSFTSVANGAKADVPPPHFTTNRMVKTKDIEQVHFCVAMKGFSQRDDRRYPLSLLDTILGGSVSSRLFQEIREKRGLAYNIASFQGNYADSALFGVYCASNPSTFQTVINVLMDILRQVKEKGVTRTELTKAKEHLKGAVSLTLESASNRMIRMARNEIYYNRFISHSEILKKIQAVKLDEVKQIAHEVLQLDSCSWAVLGPIKEEIKFGGGS